MSDPRGGTCISDVAANASSRERPAPPRLSLKWGFLATLLGRFAYAGCQWGILAVLAKMGSPETVGAYGWAIALTAPLFMFSTLQLRFVVATDAREEYEWGDFVALRLVTTGLALGIFVVLLAVGYWPSHRWLILAVASAKAIECFSDLVLGLLQQRERMDRVGWLQLVKGVGSLVVVALVFYQTKRVDMAATGMVLIWLVLLFVAEMPAARWSVGGQLSWKPSWQWGRLRRLFWFALPLGISTLLISLNSNLPRYFLRSASGDHDLGIFVAIASLVLLGETVYRAASQAVTARLAILATAGDRAGFLRILRRLLELSTVLGMVGIVASLMMGRQLLSWFYTPEYSQYLSTLVWVSVAMLLSFQSSLGPALVALRRNRAYLIVWVVAVLAHLAALAWLVPRHGIEGAGQAMVVANVVRWITMFGLLGSILREWQPDAQPIQP